MKRYGFIFLFCYLAIPVFAQRLKFSDTTNTWKMYDLSCCDGASTVPTYWFATYYYFADTILDGNKYERIFVSYIREDTIARKVFIRYFNGMTGFVDTVDELLYDYNWVVGDTVRHHPGSYPAYIFWVASIDSTMINGLWYKIWHFENGYDYYNVIEGIGCTNGFDYPVNPYMPFEFSSQLVCFSNNGAMPTLSNSVSSWGLLSDIYFDDSVSCAFHTGRVNNIGGKNEDVTIFPNPTTSLITITAAQNITALSIENCIGQMVYTEVYNSSQARVDVDVANIPPGVYLVRINGSETRRFVKE